MPICSLGKGPTLTRGEPPANLRTRARTRSGLVCNATPKAGQRACMAALRVAHPRWQGRLRALAGTRRVQTEPIRRAPHTR